LGGGGNEGSADWGVSIGNTKENKEKLHIYFGLWGKEQVRGGGMLIFGCSWKSGSSLIAVMTY